MYTCGICNMDVCRTGEIEKGPKNCPCKDEIIEESKIEYKKEENYILARNSALVEAEGYCKKTRIEEIMDFAKKCKYKKIGIAFCIGFKKETKILHDILSKNGFQVESVICKSGSISKSIIGINREEQVRPYCEHEAMCNPIGQAKLLNKANTDLNLMFGLCVGHDSLFIKYSKAPITVMAVKDRVLGHNPIQAIYLADSYYKSKLFPKK